MTSDSATPSPTPESPPPLTLVEALLPVVSLIVLISLSFFLFGDEGALGPNQIALVVATMVAAFVGWRRGYTLEALGGAPVESVSSGIGAIFILLAVGSLIGTWAMSGTHMNERMFRLVMVWLDWKRWSPRTSSLRMPTPSSRARLTMVRL